MSSHFGIMGTFKTTSDILHAVEGLRKIGYEEIETYTPFPIHGMDTAMGLKGSKLPWISLIGGLIGCATGFGLQAWTSSLAYPLMISGKPLVSWPAFIPVTFELTILFTGIATVFGMFAINKLPRYNHPVFEYKNTYRTGQDLFVISVAATDKQFDPDQTEKDLLTLSATDIELVKTL